MAGQSSDDRLENVAPGDIISLRLSDEPGAVVGQYKVVHKDPLVHRDKVAQRDPNESATTSTIVVTLAGDDGETLDVELPADTVVNRSLESKWESEQSPTPNQGF